MEKINIAELLKDCPTGMKLDCAMYDKVKLISVNESEDTNYPIEVCREDGYYMSLTKYGQYVNADFAKCIIFPKGKTTWEGFQRPFKDGDILTCKSGSVFIYKGPMYNNQCDFYFGYRISDRAFVRKLFKDKHFGYLSECRLATEEEKQKLFDAIKDNGYRWNAEKKELEKLIEPKFKVGDKVRNKNYKDYIYDIQGITDKGYRAKEIDADSPIIILFGSQEDNYELIPNKFDLATLVPFESRVLVRDYESHKWSPAIWGLKTDDIDYSYIVVGGIAYCQCIPLEGNEYLLGKYDDCLDFYKTWE